MASMGTHSRLKILFAILVLRGTCYGQECDPNGVSCINCTDYQECSGGAPKGPILSCKNGGKCGEQPLLEHCRIKLNCYALNECTEDGIFPDVMVESNYFVCLSDSGSGFLKYDFTCPEGEFFDKTARMCVSTAVTSDATLPPTPDTTASISSLAPTAETTTSAATPETTTTTSTPASTPETTTTTSTPASTPETTTTTSTPASTPETTTTTSTPASTPETTTVTSINTTPSTPTVTPTPETTTAGPPSTPTIPPSPFSCTVPGIFPNPNNCKMYFRCSTSLKAFYYICPGTSYFNENVLKCSLIITPACREQILKNTTTTPMTTISTTTTTPVPTSPVTMTTKAPAPTVTITTPSSTQPLRITSTQTPKTTATTQTPSTPFSCPAAGTFENPLDCKTYYRCSSSGKTFLYVCPNGSYYNEFTKRCGLTITPRCRSKLGN